VPRHDADERQLHLFFPRASEAATGPSRATAVLMVGLGSSPSRPFPPLGLGLGLGLNFYFLIRFKIEATSLISFLSTPKI
jgi:hypothetical protein